MNSFPSQGKEAEEFEEKLEEKIIENKIEKAEKNDISEYVVEIPSGTQMTQIHALKEFLVSEEPGKIQIFILLQ